MSMRKLCGLKSSLHSPVSKDSISQTAKITDRILRGDMECQKLY